jgi:hypothetical protein
MAKNTLIFDGSLLLIYISEVKNRIVSSKYNVFKDNDHQKLEAAISNFIILEVKTSEKGGYFVTFSIR